MLAISSGIRRSISWFTKFTEEPLLLRRLQAEVAYVKVAQIGAWALIADTIPVLHSPSEVRNCPELPSSRGCGVAEQLSRSIGMQPCVEVIDLALCKPGSVASHSLVGKPSDAFSAVDAAPFHEAGSARPANLHDLLCGVAVAVQSDGLVASTCGAVLAATVGIGEFSDLAFC